MALFGQGKGTGLSGVRPKVISGAEKMAPPFDAYYVLTKAEAVLSNSKLHPNSGSPNYDVAHAASDTTTVIKANLGNAVTVEDALEYLNDNIVTGTLYYDFILWSEESVAMSTATSGGRQYSFGNGDVATYGITIPMAGTLIDMGLQCTVSGSTNGRVQLQVNGVAQGANYAVATPGSNNSTSSTTFGTPLAFNAGDVIGFITTTSDATTSQYRAWVRVRISLGSVTGFKGDTGATGADGPVQYYNDPTTDDLLVKTRGTGADTIEQTGITCNGSNNLSGIGTVACGAITSTGALIATGTTWKHSDGGIDVYLTNQSAGQVVLGDVVSLKTNTTFQDIATAARESDMMGVAQATIASAAAGWIRIYGWTTCKAAVGTFIGVLENGSTIKTARNGLAWLEAGYVLGWSGSAVAGGYVNAFIHQGYIPATVIP